MALRKAGLIEGLKKISDVQDYGDVSFESAEPKRDPNSGLISPNSTTSMIYAVKAAVSKARAELRFPVVLGGDCPVLLGGLACFRDASTRTGLAFIDGHEDAYAPHESPTGEAADMELGFALGLKTQGLPKKLSSLFPLVDKSEVIILGARDAEIIRKDGSSSIAGMVELRNDQDIQAGSSEGIAASALSRLLTRVSAVWLHVDLDVLSTEALPAVDYPQPGGLSWEQLEPLAKPFLASTQVIGWDVTIYNPGLDREGTFARRIVQFISNGISARPLR
jgi:arginase